MSPPSNIIQNSFTVLNILCSLPIHFFFPIAGNHYPFIYGSFAFIKMSYGWSHTLCSLFRLAFSLNNTHLSFLHVFSWLDSSFLFSTEKYPLVQMYHSLFIHSFTKEHVVSSKFWQLWIKLLWTSMCRFLCGRKISTPLHKYQEKGFLIVWQEYVYFYKKPPNCLLYCWYLAFPPAM